MKDKKVAIVTCGSSGMGLAKQRYAVQIVSL